MFRVEIKKSAQKALQKLPQKVIQKIKEAIFKLSHCLNPEGEGLQLVNIIPKTFRMRVGDYRVIYRVNFEHKLIMIYKVGHRKEIYR